MVERHKDPTSWIMWCFLRYQITCHSPLCHVCQISVATVARTSQESLTWLNTCWWSMDSAVPKKYCNTDTWQKWWHAEGSALSSPTSPKRQGSALSSTGRGVLICWHLVLQVSKAGLWGHSCCCWIESKWADKEQEREKVHPCKVCDKAFKSLPTPNLHRIWQHSGHVFVCNVFVKEFKPLTLLTDKISLCVESLTTGKAFATSLCWARTTIEEIILNLNVRGAGWKKMFLASSRKWADTLYHPVQKTIWLAFSNLVCM